MKKIVFYRTTGRILSSKLILMAKLSFFCFFAMSMLSYGRGFPQTKLTMKMENVTLKKALIQLHKQSNIKILFSEDLIKHNAHISINSEHLRLEDILGQLLFGTGLDFKIIDSNQIAIVPYPAAEFYLDSVMGHIKDQDGKPIEGVTIVEKGTTNGTTTDSLGYFFLSVKDKNAQLVISRVGFNTIELSAHDSNLDNIKLVSSFKDLNEVVVVGYGTQKRKDVTGAVASVNIEDADKAPVTNFMDALSGRVAGVSVSSSDGQPGKIANIVIRGANSLSQSNSPLYVVDGFPLEDAAINSIDQNDIASIDILKDASATAIYGARGANGVVVITTKKGKSGAPIVSFNVNNSVQKNPKKLKMLNSYEFVKLQLQTDSVTNTPIYLNSDYPTLESYRNAPTLNFQDQFFKTGNIQNYDIALRGGNDKTKYSISGNVLDQKGIIITSGFKRYQGRFALDQVVSNKFKVGVNANYGYYNTMGPQIADIGVASGLTTTNASPGFLYSVWGWRPTNGSKNNTLNGVLLDQDNNIGMFNPIADLENQSISNPTTNLIANAYIEYKILNNLVFRTTGGITKNHAESDAFYNSKTYYGRDTIPGRSAIGNGVSGSVNYTDYSVWLNENTLEYNWKIDSRQSLKLLGGASFQKFQNTARGLSVIHIPSDYEFMGLDALTLAPALWSSTGSSYKVTASNSSRWTMASFLGRANYEFDDKYLLTASIRADGSSKFSTSNKWGYFSSFSAAWRFSQETFLKNSKILNDGKLRFGYGSTGNNRVGDFDYLPKLVFASTSNNNGYTYNNQAGGSGAAISSIGNSDLKWETTDMLNLGMDLSFFNNRLLVTADVYSKTTKDLLLNATIPATTGVTSAVKNIGKMRNRGLEFSFTTKNIETKNFQWTSSFNISFNTNKLLALTEGATNLPAYVTGLGIYNNYNALPAYIAQLGQSVGQMYGVVFDGLYQLNDFNVSSNGKYTLKDGIAYYGSKASIQPGWAKYKDITGDGVVNTSDYTVIGRGLPKHTGGFSNNFNYKNFDLNVFFQWSYGNDILNGNRIVFESPADPIPNTINLMASMADRWSLTNQSSNIPIGYATNYIGYNSRVIEDGSYLRLKTLSFGYNIPKDALAKMHIQSLRIFFNAQNLWTWTNYSGVDPEVSSRSSSIQTPGFDYMAYPNPRTMALGINLTF